MSIIDQMLVYAPVAAQVYQRNVEPGEYVNSLANPHSNLALELVGFHRTAARLACG